MATVRISGNALIIEKFTFLCLFISLTIGSALGFFVVTPNDTLAILGDSTQLNCSYTVDGDAAWRKGEGTESRYITEGRDSRHDDPHYEVVGDVDSIEYNLRILNIQEEHEDTFECSDLYEFGNVAPARLYIISDPPKCSVYPNNVLKVGENATFSCTIDLDANAPGELVWFLNGTEIYREEGQSSTVNLTVDIPDKGAVIDCQIQHYSLPSWKWSSVSCEEKITMDIQYLSFISMTVTPLFNITEGDEVTIHCEVLDGNPYPHKLELLFEENIISLSDERVLHHNIVSIEVSHSGIYQCNAYTLFYDGKEEHSFIKGNIVVYYSPKFVSDEFKYKADIDDTVLMCCEVHGFPMPVITWFDQNNYLIHGDEENMWITVELTDDETLVKSTLTVTVADDSYYGIYTCKATNNIEPDDEQTLEIVKQDSNSDIIAIIVTCTVIVVVVIVGIVLGILFYKNRVAKNQGSNTDYANKGPANSDYAEINVNISTDRREAGLSEEIDLSQFVETTVDKFQQKSSQHVAGQNVTSSGITKTAYETGIMYEELDYNLSGGPGQQSQKNHPDMEQMQYASLQLTPPSEYQSLK